jgi:hypothetical protein
MTVDVVNYKDVARTIYLESVIDYLPGKQKGWLEAQYAVINVRHCDSGMNGRPGTNNVQAPATGQTKWTVKAQYPVEIARDGYIISACKFMPSRSLLYLLAFHLDAHLHGKS